MKPRFNPSHRQYHRFYPSREPNRPHLPNLPDPDSRRKPNAEAGAPDPAPPGENEMPHTELVRFSLECIEKIACPSPEENNPSNEIEKTIALVINHQLPSYTVLKNESQASRHEYRQHHMWTKQLVDSVQPLVQANTGPIKGKQALSDMALQCVERNMQLKYRTDQLRSRVESMEETITRHLVQTGEEIGLPTRLLQKLANLTRSVLKQHKS